MNTEQPEGQYNGGYEEEAAQLSAKPRLVKLGKDGGEFYFDSTDLAIILRILRV